MRLDPYDEGEFDECAPALEDNTFPFFPASVEEGRERVERLRRHACRAPSGRLPWRHLATAIHDLLRWDLREHDPRRSTHRGLDEDEREALRHEQTLALGHAGADPEELALALWRDGQTDQARKELAEAVRWHPKDARVHALSGTFLCDQGDRDEGLAELRTAVGLAPDDARCHELLGLFADGEEQMDAFRWAIRLAPWHDCLREQLALALGAHSRPMEAVSLAESSGQHHVHFVWWEADPTRLAEHEAIVRAWLQVAPAGTACSEELLRHLGYLLQWRGAYRGHVERWDEPPCEGPDGSVPPDAYVELSQSLMYLGRPALAERVLRRALDVHPADPAVLTGLARTAMAQGDHRAAEEYVRDALAHRDGGEPHLSHRHLLLGEVLLRSDQPSAAAVVLRRSIALDPMNGAAHAILAEALELQRQFDKAVSAARRAVVLAPRQGWIAGVLGRMLLRRGDVPGARHALQAAARLDPNSPEVQENLAELWRCAAPDSVPPGAGLAAARRCLDLGPDRLSGYEALATALHDLGEDAKALQVAADAVRRWPSCGRAHSLYSLTLWQSGDLAGATAAAATAAHLDCTATHLHNWGWLMAHNGRLEQALSLYEAAQDKNPYDPRVSYGYALTHLLAGHYPAAEVHFERSLSRRAAPGTAGRINLYLAALTRWTSGRVEHLLSAHQASSHPGDAHTWSSPASRTRAQEVTAEIAGLGLNCTGGISPFLASQISEDPEQAELQWATERLGLGPGTRVDS